MTLLATFARFYAEGSGNHTASVRDNEDAGKKAVLVLGLNEAENVSLVSILEAWGTPPGLMPAVVTNESGQGKERSGKFTRSRLKHP